MNAGPSALAAAESASARKTPLHRRILLWLMAGAILFFLLQMGWRFWLLQAGDPVVGEVRVAQDSCLKRHRANCFLGRAIVNPRMPSHRLNVSKIPGGRFYMVGETVPMRVYPHKHLYLASVYTPVNWLLGPGRTATIGLLLLFAALMPARRRALWIVPIVIAIFFTLG